MAKLEYFSPLLIDLLMIQGDYDKSISGFFRYMRTQFRNSLIELVLFGFFIFKNYVWEFNQEYIELCTGIGPIKFPCGIYFSRIPRENNVLLSATFIVSTLLMSAKRYYDLREI